MKGCKYLHAIIHMNRFYKTGLPKFKAITHSSLDLFFYKWFFFFPSSITRKEKLADSVLSRRVSSNFICQQNRTNSCLEGEHHQLTLVYHNMKAMRVKPVVFQLLSSQLLNDKFSLLSEKFVHDVMYLSFIISFTYRSYFRVFIVHNFMYLSFIISSIYRSQLHVSIVHNFMYLSSVQTVLSSILFFVLKL